MTMEDKIDFLMDSFIEMKVKVDSLTDSFKDMKETMTTMQKDIKELKQEQDNTNKTLDLVQKDIKELKQDHKNMNEALILIEDDTSNKIPALFEGYSFHQQHIEEDEKRLDFLETKVDNHSIRISVLEQANWVIFSLESKI